MKSNIKIWRLSVIFGLAFILFSIFLNIGIAFAGDITFTPQVGFGDEFPAGKPVTVTGSTLALFIKAIYKYAIGAVGIIAAVAMMVGGLIWLTAGGDSGKVNTAKDIIKSSILGMVLLLCSFVILSTVNPDLVKLQNLNITKINEAKTTNQTITSYCCEITKSPVESAVSTFCTDAKTAAECPSDSIPIAGKTCNGSTCGDPKFGCCMEKTAGADNQFCKWSDTSKCNDIRQDVKCEDIQECKNQPKYGAPEWKCCDNKN